MIPKVVHKGQADFCISVGVVSIGESRYVSSAVGGVGNLIAFTVHVRCPRVRYLRLARAPPEPWVTNMVA